MFGKKKYSNDNAINEIVGTMLLLGISVSIFSIVYISVLTIPYPSSTPSSNIYFSLDETKIVLTHFGGKELDLESDVRIMIGDELPITVNVSDFLEDEDGDNYWGLGEQFIYIDNTGAVLENSVEVTVIDRDSNSVVLIGKKMIIENRPPVISGALPINGATGLSLSFIWQIQINDPNGDNFNWEIECNNTNRSSIDDDTNGLKTLAVSGLAESTTYTIWVNATDPSGSGEWTNNTYTFTVESWTLLTYDDFEDGTFGNYSDGGNDCELYTSGIYARGNNAANIQDNTGIPSSFYYTTGRDVDSTGYTSIKIDFWYYAISIDIGENWRLEYYDGSSWNTIKNYIQGADFVNGEFYNDIVYINETSYTFPEQMNIRFRCDASHSNGDDIYIDEIFVYVK